jgi:hypothetical protein
MKLRLWLASAACVVGATVFAGSAAADPPTVDEFSPVGDQIACGETILTIRTGTVLTRTHVHPLQKRALPRHCLGCPAGRNGDGRGGDRVPIARGRARELHDPEPRC